MISLRRIMLEYFYQISKIYGLLNFKFDTNSNKIVVGKLLNIYSNAFIIIMIIFVPINLYTLISDVFIFSTNPNIINIVWSIEYLTLTFVFCSIYMTVFFNRKSIQELVQIGIAIFSNRGRKNFEKRNTLRVFVIKNFFIDNLILTLQIISKYQGVFLIFKKRILAFCFALNFLSFFLCNAFNFILLLLWTEFEEINNDMMESIQDDNYLGS